MSERENTTENPMSKSHWSPYLVGAGIGVLSILVFLLVDKPLGMSTEVSKWSGWVASAVTVSDTVSENAYWSKTKPAFGYSTVFLLFTMLGAFISAKAGGTFRWEKVPEVWGQRFGGGPAKRMAVAFGGGFMLLFGARMAGGCTSGHGISGTLQMAVSGWIFFAVMFAAGIATAKLMFDKRN